MYGIDGSNVYMGVVTVAPRTTTTADVSMSAGIAVSGTVTYNGATVSGANVTFTNNALVKATTDGSGNYVAYLPAGLYNVSASWVQEETAGVNVTYARSFDLNLTSAVTRNIVLVRQLKGAVELKWDGNKQTVNAGESVTYDVTIYNRGNVDDTYKLSSTSSWGVTFTEDAVTLEPGSSKTIQVTIKTPADAKVSHSAIKITATSQSNTGATGSVNLDVNIVPTYGVDLSLGTSEVLNETAYTYPYQIKNTGNTVDSFNLTLSQDVIDALAVKGWDAKISGTTNNYMVVSVTAGSTKTVNVVLTKNTDTPDPNVSLAVSVSNLGNNKTADSTLPLEKASFSLPEPGMTVSGNSISMSAPQIPGVSWFLMAMIILLVAVLVILRVNKGVFGRRRKR
jgi:dolichyl-diphosphooligosaccharide--protein glycosyltransferase